LNPDGKVAWQKPLKSAVKSQAISDDGSIAVVSTYDDRITAYDSAGKELWGLDGLCQPHILAQPKRIVCYHDDDAEPNIAFRLFDWNGKVLLSFPISNDILAFKISPDGRNLAVGLTRGQVILIGPDSRATWQKRVDGEVLDLALTPGAEPRVLVLSNPNQKSQKLTLLDSRGEKLAESEPSERVEQIESSESGKIAWAYANSPDGQRVFAFSIDSEKISEPWTVKHPWYADLPPIIEAKGSPGADTLMFGFEDLLEGEGDSGSKSRHHHLLSVDAAGDVLWNIPFKPEENLYLAARGRENDAMVVAAAMDDGYLSVFRITESQ
jgi:hypothetical protein